MDANLQNALGEELLLLRWFGCMEVRTKVEQELDRRSRFGPVQHRPKQRAARRATLTPRLVA